MSVRFFSGIIEMTRHVHQVFALYNDVVSPDFHVFIHVHSINSETNPRIRYNK